MAELTLDFDDFRWLRSAEGSDMDKQPNEPNIDEPKVEVEPGADAEYGVEQLLGSEEDIAKAREHSSYRLKQDDLEHKADPIGEEE